MDRYSHTGLSQNFIEKIEIGANVQTILSRSKEKGAEFYLAFEVNSFLAFVELNYIKVAISRHICRFMNLE